MSLTYYLVFVGMIGGLCSGYLAGSRGKGDKEHERPQHSRDKSSSKDTKLPEIRKKVSFSPTVKEPTGTILMSPRAERLQSFRDNSCSDQELDRSPKKVLPPPKGSDTSSAKSDLILPIAFPCHRQLASTARTDMIGRSGAMSMSTQDLDAVSKDNRRDDVPPIKRGRAFKSAQKEVAGQREQLKQLAQEATGTRLVQQSVYDRGYESESVSVRSTSNKIESKKSKFELQLTEHIRKKSDSTQGEYHLAYDVKSLSDGAQTYRDRSNSPKKSPPRWNSEEILESPTKERQLPVGYDSDQSETPRSSRGNTPRSDEEVGSIVVDKKHDQQKNIQNTQQHLSLERASFGDFLRTIKKKFFSAPSERQKKLEESDQSCGVQEARAVLAHDPQIRELCMLCAGHTSLPGPIVRFFDYIYRLPANQRGAGWIALQSFALDQANSEVLSFLIACQVSEVVRQHQQQVDQLPQIILSLGYDFLRCTSDCRGITRIDSEALVEGYALSRQVVLRNNVGRLFQALSVLTGGLCEVLRRDDGLQCIAHTIASLLQIDLFEESKSTFFEKALKIIKPCVKCRCSCTQQEDQLRSIFNQLNVFGQDQDEAALRLEVCMRYRDCLTCLQLPDDFVCDFTKKEHTSAE